MANFQKCPQGHFYDAEKNPVCPICKSSGGIYSKIAWAVAGVAAVGAAFLFYNLQEVKSELANNEQRLEKYAEIEKVYGRGSDNYFSEQPFLILKAGGSVGRITVCWKYSTDANAEAILSSSNGISAKWADKFDTNTHLADVVVTPDKAGCFPITFTNSLNSDTFQVLVIVK